MGHTKIKRFFSLSNVPRVVDTHAHVVISKFYDVTNMQTKKTLAHFSGVSFGEIL